MALSATRILKILHTPGVSREGDSTMIPLLVEILPNILMEFAKTIGGILHLLSREDQLQHPQLQMILLKYMSLLSQRRFNL